MVFVKSHTFAVALAVCVASSAAAQTSHCISVGNNMVQCTGSGGAVTHCVGNGPTMANCTQVSPPMETYNSQSTDSGAALGNGLADFVRGIRERKFRKKIGEMLANNQCEEAARFALTKGKIELGLQLRDRCAALAVPTAVQSADQMATAMAANAKVGAEIFEGWKVSEVLAAGPALLITVSQSNKGAPISQEQFEQFYNMSCMPELLSFFQQGGMISQQFETLDGTVLDSRITDSETCNMG